MNTTIMKKCVYKITFPNGKIYIGKDTRSDGHKLSYFGSWNSDLVERDLSEDECRNLILRKEILFESEDCKSVNLKESELIRKFRSYDPNIGYNRTHRSRKEMEREE